VGLLSTDRSVGRASPPGSRGSSPAPSCPTIRAVPDRSEVLVCFFQIQFLPPRAPGATSLGSASCQRTPNSWLLSSDSFFRISSP